MGQWGISKTIDKAEFIPHISTKSFAPIFNHNLIDLIVHVNGPCSADQFELISKQYVGKQYSEWIKSTEIS